jgi:hypothetical protein
MCYCAESNLHTFQKQTLTFHNKTLGGELNPPHQVEHLTKEREKNTILEESEKRKKVDRSQKPHYQSFPLGLT